MQLLEDSKNVGCFWEQLALCPSRISFLVNVFRSFIGGGGFRARPSLRFGPPSAIKNSRFCRLVTTLRWLFGTQYDRLRCHEFGSSWLGANFLGNKIGDMEVRRWQSFRWRILHGGSPVITPWTRAPTVTLVSSLWINVLKVFVLSLYLGHLPLIVSLTGLRLDLKLSNNPVPVL